MADPVAWWPWKKNHVDLQLQKRSVETKKQSEDALLESKRIQATLSRIRKVEEIARDQ